MQNTHRQASTHSVWTNSEVCPALWTLKWGWHSAGLSLQTQRTACHYWPGDAPSGWLWQWSVLQLNPSLKLNQDSLMHWYQYWLKVLYLSQNHPNLSWQRKMFILLMQSMKYQPEGWNELEVQTVMYSLYNNMLWCFPSKYLNTEQPAPEFKHGSALHHPQMFKYVILLR